MVRSQKSRAFSFIAMVALILVINSPGFLPTVRVAGPEDDWRAHPFFIARPASLGGPDPLSPSQIIGAYNLSSTTGGAGTTIAIVDAYDDPTVASDLITFSTYFGLPMATLVKHKMATAIGVDSGWALEISLDVEWAHAIAPNATLLLVEAKTDRLVDLLAAVSYATSYPGVRAVSMSWGGTEFSAETVFDSYFSSAAINFFASSGDDGAGVMWPSSSPNVVGVGGTTLNLNSSGAVISETAWNGSGGGVSAYEAEPAYQTNYGLTYRRRAVPDVSYDADPNTGVSVYDSVPYQGSSGWWTVGGTSAGAAQWAAIQALGLSANNTNFYQDSTSSAYPSYFRDITSGSNGYSAGIGYDLVTGLGSPITTSFTPSTSQEFSMSASPATLSMGNGTTGNSTITVTALNGFNGTVSLSATPPAGWTTSLSPTSISTSGQSTLNVTVPSNVSSGTYSTTVTGTSGSLGYAIGVTVQVVSQNSTSPPPAPQTVYINANGSITPVGAPVVTSDDVTYTFTGDISYPTYYGIVVQRSDIVIDGEGYVVQGNQSGNGLYLTDINNVTIKNTDVESFYDGIILDYSSNDSVGGNNITANNDSGILLDSFSNYNSISRDNVVNNYEGIVVESSNNTINGNNLTDNYYGVDLESSSNNSISGNDIANSTRAVLLDSYSDDNNITGNNVGNSSYGVWLDSSSGNEIYHNNFINNTVQVSGVQSVNVWDDGYPSGGNYWSDYTGTDLYGGPYQNVTGSDGIGDAPYVIDANDLDYYPLMGPFSGFDGVSVVSNSTISNFQNSTGSYVSFDVSGPSGTTGFCRLTIPYSTMSPTYTVLVDGYQLPFATVYDDGTVSVIYFVYQQSTHEVTITRATGGSEGGRMPHVD